MALIFTSSFDQYGTGVAPAYDNGTSDRGWDFGTENGGDNDWTILGDTWAAEPITATSTSIETAGDYGIGTPSWGARQGEYAFYADSVNVQRDVGGGTTYTVQGTECLRSAIPGSSQHVRIINCAFSMSDLPAVANNHGMIFSFQTSAGEPRGYLGVNPSGRLVLYDGGPWTSNNTGDVNASPTVLAISGSPVISAETWQSLSIKITTNGSDDNADVEVYAGSIVPANLVIDVSGVAFTAGSTPQIDVLGLLPASMAGTNSSTDTRDTTTRWLRDLIICDDTGSYNNDVLGQVFVAAQEMRSPDSGGGWEANPRQRWGDGVLNMLEGTGVRVGDNVAFEFGSGDFTIETEFRFDALPTGTDTAVILSKWEADTNNREWKLEWDSSADELVFVISTDGTAETEIHRYPFVPDVNKWYHVAVSRDSSTTRVFINGVQQGVDLSDSNTYHAGPGVLGIGSEWNDSNSLVTASTFTGFMDEIRITKGVARYTADFTPPSDVHGRTVGEDSDFASVSLLIGCDGGVLDDDSSNDFTVTAGSGITADQPDDSSNIYDVLNRRPAWDDTNIEARNTFASSILTLTGQPLDTETVVLGSTTYTFQSSLVDSANNVQIGADTEESLSNLIAAVNAGDGAGTAYGTGTVANTAVFASALPDPQALFTATSIGTAGNSVATTETLTNGSFPDTTMAGGEDVPDPSDFAMERLPVDVTGVLGLQVTARAFKSDAGDADIRFDLKGPAGAVDTGSAASVDLNASWQRQIFEEDPDTSSTITPSTITGGRVRVTRTA